MRSHELRLFNHEYILDIPPMLPNHDTLMRVYYFCASQQSDASKTVSLIHLQSRLKYLGFKYRSWSELCGHLTVLGLEVVGELGKPWTLYAVL